MIEIFIIFYIDDNLKHINHIRKTVYKFKILKNIVSSETLKMNTLSHKLRCCVKHTVY